MYQDVIALFSKINLMEKKKEVKVGSEMKVQNEFWVKKQLKTYSVRQKNYKRQKSQDQADQAMPNN